MNKNKNKIKEWGYNFLKVVIFITFCLFIHARLYALDFQYTEDYNPLNDKIPVASSCDINKLLKAESNFMNNETKRYALILYNDDYNLLKKAFNNRKCDDDVSKVVQYDTSVDSSIEIGQQYDSDNRKFYYMVVNRTYECLNINQTIKWIQDYSENNIYGSDWMKVYQIYKWITRNIEYYNDDSVPYSEVSTAYDLIINKRGLCRGYSSLFYRMCKENGIQCRIIEGDTDGGGHSWNEVKIEGLWYCCDPTWDAKKKECDWNWFLKSDKNFPRHYADTWINYGDYTKAGRKFSKQDFQKVKLQKVSNQGRRIYLRIKNDRQYELYGVEYRTSNGEFKDIKSNYNSKYRTISFTLPKDIKRKNFTLKIFPYDKHDKIIFRGLGSNNNIISIE